VSGFRAPQKRKSPAGDENVFCVDRPNGNVILAKGIAGRFNGPPTLPTATEAYHSPPFSIEAEL
jgi:hypothetical protein